MTSAMPYVYIDDLANIFNYKNKETAYKAVQAGVFPVATYRLAGQIVADREVIREFFRLRRRRGFSSFADLSALRRVAPEAVVMTANSSSPLGGSGS